MYRIIQRFFPELFDWMREIEDYRRKPEYELAAILTACIAVFLFKAGSRNELNNMRDDPKFCKNYEKIFKMKLPHLDTVDRVMRKLEGAVLEELKRRMIQVLLNRKSLHKYRLQSKWFQVAIDGTGHSSSDHCHCEHCLHRTSKNNKTTWFHNVLEAKLITVNGFALSLGTEWIENPEGDYEKQDCERKAFIRLAEKLKKDYPRLPMCITADGLYPYKGFLDICKANDWRYIVTFKDGCLPSVWDEVRSLKPQQNENQRQISRIVVKKSIKYNYVWVTDINYNGHITQWIECLETISEPGNDDVSTRFAILTDLKPDYHSVLDLSFAGRMRWKIENEGFNAQKNHGYELKHKFSRTSYTAMKNYYQCLQIAHIINELLELSEDFQALLVGKMTIKHIWKCLQSLMCYGDVDEAEINKINAERCQIRFAT